MEEYVPKANLLSNRVILVTGASTGIGREAARTFAEFGATVILLSRNIQKLEQLYDEIVTSHWPEPAIYPFNLATASADDYTNLANRVEEEFGRLDGLLHNAGIAGTRTPIEHYDIAQWYTVLQTNLNAPFLLTRATLPLLKKSEDASIIFTSAEVGRFGIAYWGAYSVSKFGIEGLMQILADELESGKKIRVNCINPGTVRTTLHMNAYPGQDPNDILPPEAIMPFYLYLMGPDSQGITGQSIDAQS